MLNIAICDDDKKIIEEIATILERMKVGLHVELKISSFLDGSNLMQEIITQGRSFDLIFLDIEMPELTGLEFSKKLRTTQNDKITKIVFISSKDKYMAELFDFAPLRFIQKNKTREELINPQKIKEAIQYLIDEKFQKGDYFIFKKNKEKIQIPIKDIIYFKLEKRKMKVKTIYGEEYFNETLKKIEITLKNKDFVKSDKNLLVNFAFVKSFDKGNMYLYTGEKLYLSIRNKREIAKLMKEGIR